MQKSKTILLTLAVLAASLGMASATEYASPAAAGHAAHASHGLPASAVKIGSIAGLPITNSMVVTWGVALFLIVSAQLATRRMQAVPSGGQNFWEWLVESLYTFLEGIIGVDLIKRSFWFFATIFIFILFSNWLSLIPGVGTIGWGAHSEEGFRVAEPWFRGVNADLNMTLAMAMIFFVCWFVWALQANGPIGFLKHLFAPQGDTTGVLKLLMVVVFLAAGVLEVVSIAFRPVSLSFRLYGNIFAGENMLEAMAALVPNWFGRILIPIPFYFLEVLVGIVQALVFMLLTAVFTMVICQHEEEPGKPHH